MISSDNKYPRSLPLVIKSELIVFVTTFSRRFRRLSIEDQTKTPRTDRRRGNVQPLAWHIDDEQPFFRMCPRPICAFVQLLSASISDICLEFKQVAF